MDKVRKPRIKDKVKIHAYYLLVQEQLQTDSTRRLGIQLKAAISAAKSRSREANEEYELDADWVLQQWEKQEGKCFYTGLSMESTRGKGHTWSAPSLDRVDSTKRYLKNNVVLCCFGFNILKGNHDIPLLQILCRAFVDKSFGGF